MFDIRDIRKWHGEPEKTVLDNRIDQYSFDKKIEQMLKMVDKPFPVLLQDLFFDQWYDKNESKSFFKLKAIK